VLDNKEYARRRRQLMRIMGADTIAILPAAAVRYRNRDAEYPFRQDSDFYYLTGFGEPEAVAVLVPERVHGEYILFCRERDPLMETWNGRRAGPEGAQRDYGADDAFPVTDIDDILPGLMENKARIYYSMGYSPEFDQRVMGWVNRIRAKARGGAHAPVEFVALEHVLHDLRLYKSAAEVKVMRRAAKIAAAAHRRAMETARPGMMEYEVEAALLHEFRRHGAWTAYNPIVGGGANACILHYTENNAELGDGQLLLIDAGAELHGYASDITRTFPSNGRFSPAQRAIYELVLAAQQAALKQARPGRHWNDPHDAAVRALTEGLVRLGILKGRVRELIKKEAYRRFYMHRTGHWLGLDVHDVGDYKVNGQWRLLEPGMVLTVEPGLYIPAGSKGVARKWWDIGVRIEDDVLITKDGHEVLSRDAPKSVAEIEALMAQRGNGRARLGSRHA
jgi:Xaa-Pro aminopeptidase